MFRVWCSIKILTHAVSYCKSCIQHYLGATVHFLIYSRQNHPAGSKHLYKLTLLIFPWNRLRSHEAELLSSRHLVLVTSSAGGDQQLEAVVSQAGSAKGSPLLSFSLDRSRREEPAPPGLTAPQVPAELLSADHGVTCTEPSPATPGVLCSGDCWGFTHCPHLGSIHLSDPNTKDLAFWPCAEGPLGHSVVPVKAFSWHLSTEQWSCGPSFSPQVTLQGGQGKVGTDLSSELSEPPPWCERSWCTLSAPQLTCSVSASCLSYSFPVPISQYPRSPPRG